MHMMTLVAVGDAVDKNIVEYFEKNINKLNCWDVDILDYVMHRVYSWSIKVNTSLIGLYFYSYNIPISPMTLLKTFTSTGSIKFVTILKNNKISPKILNIERWSTTDFAVQWEFRRSMRILSFNRNFVIECKFCWSFCILSIEAFWFVNLLLKLFCEFHNKFRWAWVQYHLEFSKI